MRVIIILLSIITILSSCNNRSKIYDEILMVQEDYSTRTIFLKSMNNVLYDELFTTGDSVLASKIKYKSFLIKSYIKEIKRQLISNHIYDCDTFQTITYTSGHPFGENGEEKEYNIEYALSEYPLVFCNDIENCKKTAIFFNGLVSEEEYRATDIKIRLESYKMDLVGLTNDKSGQIMSLINLYDIYDPLEKMTIEWEYNKFTNVSFAVSVLNLESLLLDIELLENYSLNKLRNKNNK